MKNSHNYFTRRRIFLGSGIAAAAVIAHPAAKLIESMMKTNIKNMSAEYSMLKDIAHRRASLNGQILTIRNASFNERFDDFSCENTIFINCRFDSDNLIYVTNLLNVKFERCDFSDSQISSGIWKNVKFSNCTANGKFMILADKGSDNLLFEECELSGPPPTSGSGHENDFGTVGSLGTAVFENCKLTYLRIIGTIALTLNNSHLRKIDASTLRGNGSLILKNTEVKEYIDFKMGIFSKLVISHSTFEFMNLDRVKSERLLIADCSGHVVGKFMNLKEMEIRKSTFFSNDAKKEPLSNRRAALSLNASTINSLILQDIKFDGTNSNLYLGGNENILFDKDDPDSERFETSDFNTILIENTPLKNAFLGFIQANELKIENSEIQNSDFSHSNFQKIIFSSIKLSETIDFKDTHIGEYIKSNVIFNPNLNVISDTEKLIKG
jgi:uncharacterized protein YjbI with pentapeptide repeats